MDWERKDCRWLLQASVEVNLKVKSGAVPLGVKHVGVKPVSMKENWALNQKGCLGTNNVNRSSSFVGTRVEFHSWRSANTLNFI